MAERFEPIADARPQDVDWPNAIWPPAVDAVLLNEFVELRCSDVADAGELFESLDSDQVWQHVAGRPADAAAMAELISAKRQRAGWFPWTVRLRQPVGSYGVGQVVGTTSYLETSQPDARTEIGSTLYAESVWGSAVNPACKLLLLDFAFSQLRMGRVQLKTDVRNHRSQQAIAQLGARFEGVLRRYQRRADGSVRDTALFSITAEDWPTVRARLEGRLAQFSSALDRG